MHTLLVMLLEHLHARRPGRAARVLTLPTHEFDHVGAVVMQSGLELWRPTVIQRNQGLGAPKRFLAFLQRMLKLCAACTRKKWKGGG